MTLRHMRIFIAVAENESITHAAEKLYIAQPTVSVAIRELEEHYGIRLFERYSQRLHITENGRRFLGYARHLIEVSDEMEKQFSSPDQQGLLRLAASVTVGAAYMPALVRRMQEAFPDLEIRVQIDTTDAIEQAILDNKLDAALVEGILHTSALNVIMLAEDHLSAVCAPTYPAARIDKLSPEALLRYPLLMRETRCGASELFRNALATQGLEATPAWESTSVEVLKSAARQGLGIAILPEGLIRSELEDGSLLRLTIDRLPLKRSISLIHHKNKFISPAMRFFEQISEAALKANNLSPRPLPPEHIQTQT